MTPATLKAIMLDLEFNTNDVAVICGVTRRTTQLWTSGRSPVPQSCALVLMGLADQIITLDWVLDQIAPRSGMN